MLNLSVIIPIYNTDPPVLTRCLDSLSSLEGISWECILVDDGSEAPVEQTCRKYTAAKPNFRYFRKENGGVSSARNLGLDQAHGKYIMFVDADDVLQGTPIVQVLNDANEDVLLFDMEQEKKGTVCSKSTLAAPAGPVARQQILEGLIRSNALNSPFSKLWRRELLETHQLRFATQFVTGEDWLFIAEVALHAESFRYVPQACYRYLYTTASASSRLIRFPDQVTNNIIARYKKKQQLLEEIPPHRRQECGAQAAALLTETLFNTASELLLAKLYTPSRKKLICDTVVSVMVYASHMPKKSRIKAQLLLRFPLALRLAAASRNAYLATKR